MADACPEPVILDSVTHLGPGHRGRVVYGGSHGGTYAAYYAASKGVAAVILNDAGIGRERAGVAGLRLLEELGVPAAAVSHRTGRIGDGHHASANGILSTVNGPARRLGLAPGQRCMDALQLLCRADLPPSPAPRAAEEFRTVIRAAGRGGIKVIAMDSISLVTPGDKGHVIIAASHGALLAGKPETAVKVPVFAAVTNDADRGIDEVGISRLPAMDAMGIAGACVSAFSARIGDGMSIYNDGYISAINATAERHGGEIGQSCREFVARMVEARSRQA
jgi:hypothetical protein